jgi:NlpC/P60 family putative phage cell wall peptidase
MILRADVVAEARSWIGTPYRHQAALKGVGCDCLGLILGLHRAMIGDIGETVPSYTPHWAEVSDADPLLAAAQRHLMRVDEPEAQAGDVLLFRYRAGAPAKHAAILASAGTMIHAYDGTAVVETSLGPWWRRRIAGAFAFPGVMS